MAQYTVEFYRIVTELTRVTVDATADSAEYVAREHLDGADWEAVHTGEPVVENVVLEE